jgi:WD40 repeat protein
MMLTRLVFLSLVIGVCLHVDALPAFTDDRDDDFNSPMLVSRIKTQGLVRRVAFSRFGDKLATGDEEGTVRLWNPVNGRELRNFRLPVQANVDDSWVGNRPNYWPMISELCISADAHYFASSDGSRPRRVRIWDVTNGHQQCELQQTTNPGMNEGDLGITMSLSPDGTMLAVAAAGRGSVRLIDSMTGKEQIRTGDFNEVWDLLFSPDSETLTAVANPTIDPSDMGTVILILDAKTLKPRKVIRPWETRPPGTTQTGRLMSWKLAFSADGKLVATYGTEIRVFEVATLQPVLTIPGKAREHGKYLAIALAHDGRILAIEQDRPQQAGYSLHQILPQRTPVAIPRKDLWPDVSVFSANADLLATATHVKNVLVWDVNRLLGKQSQEAAPMGQDRIEELWATLGGDAAPAYEAICKFVQSPKGVVAFLKDRLKPVERRDLSALIAELDSDSFPVRQAASTKLAQLGFQAEPALRAASSNHRSLEFAQRVDDLLKTLDGHPIPPDELRSRRSIQVLEYIGTAEAEALLQHLATGDPDVRLTQEASEAIRRLKSWKSAGGRPGGTP